MEILLLIMEKSWNNHGILILNFCGNPVFKFAVHVFVSVDDQIFRLDRGRYHDVQWMSSYCNQ